MKTIETKCGECGQLYQKPIHDLNLEVGDKVIHKSWVGSGCAEYPITITDITHKAQGLYFGWRNDDVWPEKVIDHYRVDTRNHEFVKVS